MLPQGPFQASRRVAREVLDMALTECEAAFVGARTGCELKPGRSRSKASALRKHSWRATCLGAVGPLESEVLAKQMALVYKAAVECMAAELRTAEVESRVVERHV